MSLNSSYPLQAGQLVREARQLVELVQSSTTAGSRLEQTYWEQQINTLLGKLLNAKKDKLIESALDYLSHEQDLAYEVLIERIETLVESSRIEHQGEAFDVLLFSVPVVLWTRYQLPARSPLSPQLIKQLASELQKHILGSQAQYALVPELLGFEQMPHLFSETQAWTQRLGRQAIEGKPASLRLTQELQNDGVLAEARFLVGAVVVPAGGALFRWQEAGAGGLLAYESAISAWKQAAERLLGPLLTGCSSEYLNPGAYYSGNRQADQQLRPAAVKASITWLQSSAGLQPDTLRATIAACGQQGVEEFRIGLTPKNSTDVIYGCVWPALTREEVSADALDPGSESGLEAIYALLKSLGLVDIRSLPGLFECEVCEDCGAPYFPNPLGEMMHPELPEDFDINPISFH